METKTKRQKTGDVGEEIAMKFLMKRGFVVVERNYWKKFGEIDIICRKDGKMHFVEVKTVSRETVSRETSDEHRAEDNIHPAKLKRIGRTIAVYLNEKGTKEDWEFHAVVVVLDITRKIARVRFLGDLII
ncbi:MAG: YraN family protein [Patescibacteria group bacterium]